jgi:16S rRNA (cytosine967-C5)-methyltransferase
MQNKGLLWASDTAAWRLDILKKRAGRAKVFNYRTKLWKKGSEVPTKTMFSGVLVDAPCSGVGTWGRNPHARWTTTGHDVLELARMQRDILGKVAASVKSGGKLVYSVCTLTSAETREIKEWFTEKYPEFHPLKVVNPLDPSQKQDSIELLPPELHANGMYVALWQRS